MADTGARHAQYQYTPLSHDQIRIIKILPGSDAQISLKVELVALTSKPFYHALSYCWEDGAAAVECQCLEDGAIKGIICITESLHLALKQIRHEIDEIPMWVDQLCIDQKNEDEKIHQIRLMRQIYTSAHQVVIWLGEADDDTSLVFSLIQNVYDQIMQQVKALGTERAIYDPVNPRSAYCPLDLTSADTREWVAFRKLLQRPWFDRVWTVQELVLPKRNVIACGPNTITWKQLWLVCHCLRGADAQGQGHESHLREVDRDIRYLFACWFYQNSEADAKKGSEAYMTFTNLLRKMMRRRTSIPEDKIYGILGLAVDIDISSYPIDYKQPFRHIYSYATKYIINQYSDLEVLRCTSILPVGKTPQSGPRIRPSWVPDYRFDSTDFNNMWAAEGPVLAQHGRFRLYNATGMSKAGVAADDSLDLCLQGICLGTIDYISDSDGCLESQVSIGHDVAHGGQWANMAASVCSPDGTYPPTNESIRLAYDRLRIRDYLPGEYTRADRLARSEPMLSVPEPLESSCFHTPNGEKLLKYDKEDVVTVKIINSCRNHKLALLSIGYMGLVHQSCVLGDEVWLLMGGDMPYVLRPLMTGKYEFKGETYVHGVMEGEYLIREYKPVTDIRDNQTWLDDLAEEIPFDTKDVVLT